MSTTDPHPSTEVLAEYVEGSLPDDTSAGTAAHVERCPVCQDVIEELNAVRTALRDLPAEQPVPEHVSARVFAAISAESAGGVEASSGVEAGDDDTGTVAWFRRRAPRALALAASVAVVGLAGYVAVTSGNGGDVSTAGDAEQAESSAVDAGPKQPNAAQDETNVLRDDADGAGTEVPDPAALRTATRDVWENRAELAPGCGEALAVELGLSLVGSAESGPGVLIVLEDESAGQLQGHVMATCGSTTPEELSAPVTLTRPE